MVLGVSKTQGSGLPGRGGSIVLASLCPPPQGLPPVRLTSQAEASSFLKAGTVMDGDI